MSTATQTEVARNLGISRSTVAAALNPNSTVKLSEATRKRILDEVNRLNYRPHRYAQIMRAGRSGLIGVFHFGGLSQVAAERAWHAARALEAAGYRILVTDSSWTHGGTKAGCEAMLDARVEGVLVASLNDTGSVAELEVLRQAGLPIVALSGNQIAGVPLIRGDACAAMQALTEHLIALGRRRLVLLTAFATLEQPEAYLWAGAERIKGFKAAIRAAGGRVSMSFSTKRMTGPQGLIASKEFPLAPFDPYRPGLAAMREVLETEPLPDAVLCGNDDWAVGALAACREHGLSVPADLALTGYDNTAICEYLNVPLTSVAQPSQAMAEHAVKLLLDLIQGNSTDVPDLIKFPCELVLRKSCGSN